MSTEQITKPLTFACYFIRFILFPSLLFFCEVIEVIYVYRYGYFSEVRQCFERASEPFMSDEARRRLLSFVVVGGGPTGIEFTAELSDVSPSETSPAKRA